jgi:hypothetical protein
VCAQLGSCVEYFNNNAVLSDPLEGYIREKDALYAIKKEIQEELRDHMKKAS